MAFKVGDEVVAQPLKKKDGTLIGGIVKGKVVKTGCKALGEKFDYAIDDGTGNIIYRDDRHMSVPGAAPQAPYKQPDPVPHVHKRDDGSWLNRDTRGDALKLEQCQFCNNGLLYYPMSKAIDKDKIYDMIDPDYVDGCDHFILVPAESALKDVPSDDKRPVERCSRCRRGSKVSVDELANAHQKHINVGRLAKRKIVAIIKVPVVRRPS